MIMKTMIRFTAAVLSLLALGGCATTAGDTIRTNAAMVKAESTPDKLLERGDAYASVNDMTRAEQYYAASLAAQGNPALLVRRLIRACVSDQRYRVAIDYAENYLRKAPTDNEVRFALATMQGAIGDAPSARDNFEKVLRQTPNDADAHFAVGLLLRDGLKDPFAADKHFRDYLRISPGGPNAEQAKTSLLKTVTR